MKICIVGDLPKPTGGVAIRCYQITRQFTEMGNEVFFYDTSLCHPKSIPNGVSKYRCFNRSYEYASRVLLEQFYKEILLRCHPPIISKLISSFLSFQCIKYSTLKDCLRTLIQAIDLYKFIYKSPPDIIHSHHAGNRTHAALIVGKILKIPTGVTIHASSFTHRKSNIQKATILCNIADFVIAVSEKTKNIIIQSGVRSLVEVVYNAVDFQKFNPSYNSEKLKAKLNITKDEKVILYVGWLIERKGPQVLLRSLEYIKEEKIKVIIVGPDYGIKSELENIIREKKLEKKVLLLGEVSFGDLRVMYVMADIFVFPTITEDEGFGIVALEAMASGTPVIASNIAAIPEVVIDQHTGLLFEPNNEKDLAEKIIYLLNNESIREKLGIQARKISMNRFSWESSAKKLLEIYDRVTT